MANDYKIVQGAYAAWKLTIRGEDEAVVTTWTDSAVLAATCWPGDDQAELFAPSVEWISAAAGTIKLSVSEAQSAALAVGSYPINVTITGSDGPITRPAGMLRVEPAPGDATARTVYNTLDDMKRHAGSWLESLQRSTTDQTGYREERADAREEFEEHLHMHYKGAGSLYRMERGWMATRMGGKDEYLADELAADHLLVTARIKEWCSLRAIMSVCARQIDADDGDKWAKATDYFERRAERLLPSIVAEIDTDGDGEGDFAINLGSVPRIRG